MGQILRILKGFNKSHAKSKQSFNTNTTRSFQTMSTCSDFISKLSQLQTEYPNLAELRMFNELIQMMHQGSKDNSERSQTSVYRQWNQSDQQDNIEVLSFLLNRMYEDIRKKIKQDMDSSENTLKFKLPMMLSMKNEITCQCGVIIYSTMQSKLSLHIRVSSKYANLQNLIDKIFSDEVIENFNCGNGYCSQKTAIRACKLCRPLPETLCIRVEANNLFMTMEILNKIVIKNEFLVEENDDYNYDIHQIYNTHSFNCDFKYNLKSVIKNDSGLRYQCYKHDNNKWVLINDDSVIEVEEQKILEDHDYILFFEMEKQSHEYSSVYSTIVTSVEDSNSYYEVPMDNSMVSLNNLDSKRRSKRIMNTLEKLKSTSDLESNFRKFITRKRPISLVKHGANHYLDVAIHAVSSCEKMLKEMQILTNRPTKKLNKFLDLIRLSDQDSTNVKVSKQTIQALNNLYKSNLFHFMTALLKNVCRDIQNRKLRMYPFNITMAITLKCASCGEHFQFHLSEISMNIYLTGVMSSLYFLQDAINNIFQEQAIEGYSCVNKQCTTNRSIKTIKLCLPIPKTFCINIEKLIWNGSRNQVLITRIKFSDVIIIKNDFCENVVNEAEKFRSMNGRDIDFCNNDLIYRLQSIVSYEGCDENGDHYDCYKRLGSYWYKINGTSISTVTLDEVLECNPYLMFYELFE